MTEQLRGKRVAVAGMGKSGIAAAELLHRHGAVVTAVDERDEGSLPEPVRARLRDLSIPLQAQTEQAFTGADLIILSPGVPPDIAPVRAASAAGIRVLGEVELAGWFLKGRHIGITGANGKTTTTALIGHLLRTAGLPHQVGGNIGTPPTAMVDTSTSEGWNVLELSSFQLETTETFRVNIALALNITPDHLDRHGTFEKYVDAKARMFELQGADDNAVLNADDPVTEGLASRTEATVWRWSRKRTIEKGAFVSPAGELVVMGLPLMRTADIPLKGMHNVENVLAAATAATLAGVNAEAIREGVKTFPGVEHRIEFVRERGGVLFFNDSKATNVDATEKAIDSFEAPLWLILGGKDKGSDYSVLRSKLEAKAKRLLLIGAAAEKIADQLAGLPFLMCGTIQRAVEEAARGAVTGDVVLLAPACASFDQFQSYEHRGRVFKELVRAL